VEKGGVDNGKMLALKKKKKGRKGGKKRKRYTGIESKVCVAGQKRTPPTLGKESNKHPHTGRKND